MAYLHHKYYSSYDNYLPGLKILCSGVDILNAHPLLSRLEGGNYAKNSHLTHKGSIACGTKNGQVYVNHSAKLTPEKWAYAIAHCLLHLASTAGGHNVTEETDTPVKKAAAWFLARYPLFGGLAASFKIIEDTAFCQRNEIQIAAVDASLGEIYANPACGYTENEWRFVLANEYLHAGLCHHKRCQGRALCPAHLLQC